jgi:hypothetical protein
MDQTTQARQTRGMGAGACQTWGARMVNPRDPSRIINGKNEENFDG